MPKQPLFVHQPNNSVCSSGRADWRLTHALATCGATQIRFYLRAVTRRASCHYVAREKQLVIVRLTSQYSCTLVENYYLSALS